MPFRYTGDLRALKDDPLYGDGECIQIVKMLVPGLIGISTQSWKQGASVLKTLSIAPGTAIATFGPDGRFPRFYTGQHAALFVKHAGVGFYLVEQYRGVGRVLFRHLGVPAGEWKQRPDGTWPQRSRNPHAFSIIEI
jgi:hypothetical protein